MDYNSIIKNLEKKIYHPVYVLMGEEPYFIDKVSDYITDNVLDEAEKSFNLTILYGKDTSIDTIVTAAKRFPMMAAYQIVVVREAQNLNNLEEDLLSYVEKPMPSTILVICYKYKNLDKRKKFIKAAGEKGIVYESKKIYENKLAPWMQEYCGARSYKIDPKALSMLTEYLGTEISKVANELDKLMILLPAGSTITASDIEKNIGISKDYNVYELQNALGQKDVLKANRIVNYFGANPSLNPLPKTMASLCFYFTRLLKYHLATDKSPANLARTMGVQPFLTEQYVSAARRYPAKKVVHVISLLREYDMKSKGIGNVSATPAELQRELIYKILH